MKGGNEQKRSKFLAHFSKETSVHHPFMASLIPLTLVLLLTIFLYLLIFYFYSLLYSFLFSSDQPYYLSQEQEIYCVT